MRRILPSPTRINGTSFNFAMITGWFFILLLLLLLLCQKRPAYCWSATAPSLILPSSIQQKLGGQQRRRCDGDFGFSTTACNQQPRRVAIVTLFAAEKAVSAPSLEDGPTTTTTTNATKTTTLSCWMIRAHELAEFYRQYGHTLVPKRYKANPSLGNWVNKQRQQRKRYYRGLSSSLTPQRIDVLNQLHFVWDASNITSTQIMINDTDSSSKARPKDMKGDTNPNDTDDDDDEEWWRNFRELRDESNYTKVADIPRHSPLGKWIHRQRESYSTYRRREHNSSNIEKDPSTTNTSSSSCDCNNADRYNALHALDPDWYLSYREYQWEQRYRELQTYKQKYGDCCVPMPYNENNKLAHWVSTQRKQYNLLQKNKPSHMTKERQRKLQSIGFVWNRWEYEWRRKLRCGDDG